MDPFVKTNFGFCQGKVEMSASWQSRNVRLGVGLWKRHVKLNVPVKRRRALLASNPLRNNRSELIRTMGWRNPPVALSSSDGSRWREAAAPVRAGMRIPHRTIDSAMPSKTHVEAST